MTRRPQSLREDEIAPSVTSDPVWIALKARVDADANSVPRNIHLVFFVRYSDERIAVLINYPEARANYAMLNQIPERLRAHANRVGAELEVERQKLGAFEQIASSRPVAGH